MGLEAQIEPILAPPCPLFRRFQPESFRRENGLDSTVSNCYPKNLEKAICYKFNKRLLTSLPRQEHLALDI